MERSFIGVDTSNYTTSAAAVLESGEVVANVKRLLPGAKGERGLRQSDAVFAHVKAMPSVLAELGDAIGKTGAQTAAVGYSYAPREVEGSYMPCFLVGEAVANAIAADRALPVFLSSHQAGHIMAALYSANALDLAARPFAAFHVSGGTTELLLVTPDDAKVISAKTVGGTRDLNAGQLVDRVGVSMGFSFPAGRELDELALSFDGKVDRTKISVSGLECDLSGAENLARGVLERTGDKAACAAFTLEFVAATLLRLTGNLREAYPDVPVVYAGGVMSSRYIKNRLAGVPGAHFASAQFSSDNAAGCALLCLEKWKRKRRTEAE